MEFRLSTSWLTIHPENLGTCIFKSIPFSSTLLTVILIIIVYYEAFKRLLIILNRGMAIKTIAIAMKVPEIGRVKNTEKSPSEISRDCRMAGSVKGPRTMARTAGANG